jgi:hypothetical protein
VGVPPAVTDVPPPLDDTVLPSVASDRAVWDLGRSDPDYVLVDSFYGSTGGPPGEPVSPGAVITLTDPRTGRQTERTVAGIVRDGTPFYGVTGADVRFPVFMSDVAVAEVSALRLRRVVVELSGTRQTRRVWCCRLWWCSTVVKCRGRRSGRDVNRWGAAAPRREGRRTAPRALVRLRVMAAPLSGTGKRIALPAASSWSTREPTRSYTGRTTRPVLSGIPNQWSALVHTVTVTAVLSAGALCRCGRKHRRRP